MKVRRHLPGLAAAALALAAPWAAADEPPAPPPGAPVPEVDAVTVVLRAGTLIPMRMQDTVGSATSTGGQAFLLVVTDDIHVDERLVIPAGTLAHGEVIHAAKAGMFGKAGELSITSRYLLLGERRIRLRSLLAAAGQNKADLAMGVGLVIPFAPFFIRGKDLVVPADTELIARVAVDESFDFETTVSVNPGSNE